MPRRETDYELELDHSGADTSPGIMTETAKAQSVYETTRENYEAGRTDIKSRGAHIGTFRRSISKEQLKAIAGVGYFLIESLENGRAVDKKLIEVKRDVEVIEPEQRAQPVVIASAPQIDIEAITKAATDAAARAMAEVLAADRAEREKAQATVVTPADPFEAMDKALQFADRLQERAARGNPASQTDPFDQVIGLVDKVTSIQERMQPPASYNPESSTFDKILGVVDSAMRNVPKALPMLMQVAQARAAANGQQSAQHVPTPPATPAPVTPAPVSPAEQVTATVPAPPATVESEQAAPMSDSDYVLGTMFEAMRDNKPVRRSARLLCNLMDSDSTWQAQIEMLLTQPTPVILEALAAQGASANIAEVVRLPHAPEWMDRLRAEIAQRQKKMVVDVSPNGNGQHAAAI